MSDQVEATEDHILSPEMRLQYLRALYADATGSTAGAPFARWALADLSLTKHAGLLHSVQQDLPLEPDVAQEPEMEETAPDVIRCVIEDWNAARGERQIDIARRYGLSNSSEVSNILIEARRLGIHVLEREDRTVAYFRKGLRRWTDRTAAGLEAALQAEKAAAAQ